MKAKKKVRLQIRSISLLILNIIFSGFGPALAASDSKSEEPRKVSRRAQFLEHRRLVKIHDEEREKALILYLEEQEQWQQKRLEAQAEHQKRREARAELRGEEAHREYLQGRLKDLEDDEEKLVEFFQQRALSPSGQKSDLKEDEELDLLALRPRYEIKKRVLYGAKPTGKKDRGRVSSLGKSTSSGKSDSDFGPGFAPIPSMPESDFGDFPPPPPPPSMSPFEESDFPPPPPPPPAFDEGDGF